MIGRAQINVPVAAGVPVAMIDVDAAACRALWCAVIQEQLRLACGVGFQMSVGARERAGDWFRSRDFESCCEMAGLDADWVRRGALRRIEKGAVFDSLGRGRLSVASTALREVSTRA